MSYSSPLLKALRPHQWLKNLLVLVPALAAHRLDLESFLVAGAAFVTFSFAASGGYVLNDLHDLESDRLHPRKRHRPFASGALSRTTGVVLVALLWSISFGLAAAVLPNAFVLVIAVYLAATMAYSWRLKREPVLDVVILALLYVIRVLAGGVAGNIFLSNWLLAFTLFVSLSLAFLKRFIEVRDYKGSEDIPGRGYRGDDAAWLHSAGLSAAFVATVVLAIYANSDDSARLYRHPERLLLLCPLLLYWATRAWLRAHRGEMHDDPVVAVAFDPSTYVVVAISVMLVALSL